MAVCRGHPLAGPRLLPALAGLVLGRGCEYTQETRSLKQTYTRWCIRKTRTQTCGHTQAHTPWGRPGVSETARVF